ncbi:hypothetical protein QWY86_07990 [Pedobacter aquatilis]|uniref:anti-sigma factor family protein n=1 Tax=Pedobacter aquatilis TaxID=351343 RepID=UPI0025B2F9CA|nr:hypothetical protein [Pedobacter aquatilis]MDN3586600.1 hypothetical protein [Pedobacter aquatilis]
MEQQLWDYIDGNLNDAERNEIEHLLATDVEIKQQYEELLLVNETLSGIEIDAPSMSFTRNVMENVALEPAPVVLKTKVDTRIIFGIAMFFLMSILGIFGYVISTTNFTMPNFNLNLSLNFSIENYITPTALYVFIGIDLILALIFVDYFLRKKLVQKV